MYNIHPTFWNKLYRICGPPKKKPLPIIDLLGPWFSPLAAAVYIEVPYFNIDTVSERYAYLSSNSGAISSIINLNAFEEKINHFLSRVRKQIKYARDKCKLAGKSFLQNNFLKIL